MGKYNNNNHPNKKKRKKKRKKKLQLYLLGEPSLDIGEFKIVYNILKLLMISQPNGEFNFGKIADGLQSTSLYLDKLNK